MAKIKKFLLLTLTALTFVFGSFSFASCELTNNSGSASNSDSSSASTTDSTSGTSDGTSTDSANSSDGTSSDSTGNSSAPDNTGKDGTGSNSSTPDSATPDITENLYVREGDYIYFGSYPQTKVTATSDKAAMLSWENKLPTAEKANGWTDYGYYIERNVTSYMWYVDVELEGEKYRGVYFTSYRPSYTSNSSSESNSYQDDNGYTLSTVYWFKYEPLKWRVLKQENGTALLMCDSIIDSQAYQNSMYESGSNRYTNSNGAPSKTYANNYEYSTIRSWLNDTFYNTAFTAYEKAIIELTEVDNGEFTTGNYFNKYACANTNDYVFLLSHTDVINENYGFDSYYGRQDSARSLKTTDYAQSQGAGELYYGKGYWWVRSPSSYDSYFAQYVHIVGTADDASAGNVNCIKYGVVPALQINL